MFPWNLFPFNKDTKNMMSQMKPEEIHKYIQELMANFTPQQMNGMNPHHFMNDFHSTTHEHSPYQDRTKRLNTAIFETHDFVFVRIHIEKEEWLKQLKLFYTSNQLIIEQIPEKKDKHHFTLPSIVKKKGATAHFKDGTLEIKIHKNIDLQFSEIDVTEL